MLIEDNISKTGPQTNASIPVVYNKFLVLECIRLIE